MSIDLSWDTLTTGEEGQALAQQIRDFIHDKFQAVALPRFVKSVAVHSFEFGAEAPRVELRDVTDPLPDFYHDHVGEDEDEDEDDGDTDDGEDVSVRAAAAAAAAAPAPTARWPELIPGHVASPFLGVSTPGMLGAGAGASNMHYFHSHFKGGTHTPLAAVAGARLSGSWHDLHQAAEAAAAAGRRDYEYHDDYDRDDDDEEDGAEMSAAAGTRPGSRALREKSSVSTLGPTRPPTRHGTAEREAPQPVQAGEQAEAAQGTKRDEGATRREARPDDVQAVFRIRYAGGVRLTLTAEILLDYPMPSFVGIPVRLGITGLMFDGVGVLARIRRRVHFCFLGPDDALAAVGQHDNPDSDLDANGQDAGAAPEAGGRHRFGGLIQDIKVESEIGLRDGTRQSLRNVGKVERFVLEQVRRIFEEEFVYPSYWTFLV